jgi:hypothetical protein
MVETEISINPYSGFCWRTVNDFANPCHDRLVVRRPPKYMCSFSRRRCFPTRAAGNIARRGRSLPGYVDG